MFKTITPMTPGRNFDNACLDQIRISITKGGKRAQVNFHIGQNVMDRLGWKAGDRIQIQVDAKPQLFWLMKNEAGYKLSLGGGNNKTTRIYQLAFTSREELASFAKDFHAAKMMRHSFPDDGGVYVWYQR